MTIKSLAGLEPSTKIAAQTNKVHWKKENEYSDDKPPSILEPIEIMSGHPDQEVYVPAANSTPEVLFHSEIKTSTLVLSEASSKQADQEVYVPAADSTLEVLSHSEIKSSTLVLSEASSKQADVSLRKFAVSGLVVGGVATAGVTVGWMIAAGISLGALATIATSGIFAAVVVAGAIFGAALFVGLSKIATSEKWSTPFFNLPKEASKKVEPQTMPVT